MYPIKIGLAFCTPHPVVPGPTGPRPDTITMEWHRKRTTLSLPTNFNIWEVHQDGKPIDEARNDAIAHCLAQKNRPEFIFFLDNDVLPEHDALTKLIYRARHFPEHDVFAGVYVAKWMSPPEPLIYGRQGAGPLWDWTIGDVLHEGVEGVHMGCFPPGERVRRAGDWQPIEQLQVGEQVLTHEGRLRTVTKTMVRDYRGDLIEVTPYLVNQPVRLTPEHPVWAVKLAKNTAQHRQKLAGTYQPAWVAAGDLTCQHAVVYRFDTEIEAIEQITLSDTVPEATVDEDCLGFENDNGQEPHWVQNTVAVTADLLRLCGYYLAEGHARRNSVRFCFGEHETAYIEDAKQLVQRVFGVRHCGEYRGNGGHQIIVSSTALSQWFQRQFGRGSAHKQLPKWVLRLPPELQRSLLRGYFHGDGHPAIQTGRRMISCNSKSELLILQVRDLLLRQGVIPSFRKEFNHGRRRQHRFRFALIVAGAAAEQLLPLLWPELRFSQPRQRPAYNYGWIVENRLFLPIRKLKTVPYTGPVYNCSVADDESYAVSGFSVHNCTLVRLACFEKVPQPWFKTTNERRRTPQGYITQRGTEDLFFCQRAVAAGVKILVDTSVLCGHIDKDTGVIFGLPWDSGPVTRARWMASFRSRDGRKPDTDTPPVSPDHEERRALDLGAGETRREWDGYTTYTTDIRSGVADYQQDTRLLNLPDEHYDLVASSHHLEHLGRWDQEQAWKEIFRVTKPGGRIEHIVPSAEWAATKMVLEEVDEHVLNVLYGAQEAHGYERQFNTHFFPYTKKLAKHLAEAAGFSDIQTRDWRDDPSLGYNLVITGRKPCDPPESGDVTLVVTGRLPLPHELPLMAANVIEAHGQKFVVDAEGAWHSLTP